MIDRPESNLVYRPNKIAGRGVITKFFVYLYAKTSRKCGGLLEMQNSMSSIRNIVMISRASGEVSRGIVVRACVSIWRIALIAVLSLLLLVACKREEVESPMPLVEFGVKLGCIEHDSVEVEVSYDSDAEYSWYGFVTTDLTTPVVDLVKEELSGGRVSVLQGANGYIITIGGLEQDTQYRYVVAGVTERGSVYGVPAEVRFRTERVDEYGMKCNGEWKLSYMSSEWIDGMKVENVLEMDNRDRKFYSIAIIADNQYNINSLRSEAEALRNDIAAYVEAYNAQYSPAIKFEDMLYRYSALIPIEVDMPGRYRAVAFGFDAKGTITGDYAVSSSFLIRAQTASEAYEAWLGDWRVVGANGAEYSVTLEARMVNRSFLLEGWEALPFDIVVEYDAENDALTIASQCVAEGYDLGAGYGKADIYLVGGDKEGYYDATAGDYYIAASVVGDNGAMLVGYGADIEGYPAFEQMFFMADIAGKWYAFSDEADIPSLPAELRSEE